MHPASNRLAIRVRRLAAAQVFILAASLLSPLAVSAYVTTDQLDYGPGSVVTITGSSTSETTYFEGNTVEVVVTNTDNGWAASCDPQPTVDAAGAWSCPVTLSQDAAVSVGTYTYTATQKDADGNVVSVEYRTFTDSIQTQIINAAIAPASPTTADPLAFSGTLQYKVTGTTFAALAGKTVAVTGPYAIQNGMGGCNQGGGSSVGTDTTNATGGFSVSLGAQAAGTYWFRADYAGDGPGGTYGSANVCVSVTVATPTLLPGSVAINNIPGSAVYGGSFTPMYTKLGTGTASTASLTSSVCTVASGVVSFIAPGTCALQASVTADATYDAATGAAQSFVVGKATLTVTASSPADGHYGDAVPAITPAYSGFVLGEDASDLATAPTCSTTYTQGAVPATYPTSCSGGVSDNYAFNYVAGSFVVGKATLTVTADNQSAQYSDANPALTFQYAGFVLDQDASVIDTPPTCSTTRLVTSPASPPTFPITCSGGLDTNYSFSYVAGTFTVTTEDATVAFDSDNPAGLQVSAPGGSLNAGALQLKVTVMEKEPDLPTATALAGDISNAGLTVTLASISGGSTYALNCPSAVVGIGYAGVKTFTCSNSAALPVDAYDVTATVAGNYYAGSSLDEFTVYDPSLGFATGGGKFFQGDRVNFGFVMKYNKSGSSLKGSFVAVRHHPDGTVSRIKSNALGNLALQNLNSCGVANFDGKATYTTWDRTANSGAGGYVNSGGNSFRVQANDCNEPGTGADSIWIGGPGDFNMGGLPTGSMQTLTGGNIVVPHTLGKK